MCWFFKVFLVCGKDGKISFEFEECKVKVFVKGKVVVVDVDDGVDEVVVKLVVKKMVIKMVVKIIVIKIKVVVVKKLVLCKVILKKVVVLDV